MKKIFRRISICLLLMALFAVAVAAVEYDDSGYYNASIFIQNNLDEFYHDHLDTAVGYWDGYDDDGNKHLPGRNIVINTVSSSEITNISFRGHPEYGLLNTEMTYGLYTPGYVSTSSCTCHTTRSFTILINDYFAREATDEYLLTSNEVLATIVHEIGHTYGLIDFDEDYYVYDSIMSYRVNNDRMFKPQERDYRNARASWVFMLK